MDSSYPYTSLFGFSTTGMYLFWIFYKKPNQADLDIISFTDHNTIAGYRKLREEIEQLELLEKLGRLLPDEKNTTTGISQISKQDLITPGYRIYSNIWVSYHWFIFSVKIHP